MADAGKEVLYCLKPKKAKSRAILLKKDNFTVGKNADCDLPLNSAEIEPLFAKLIKYKNKQGWYIVNYSSSEGASTVRVNRLKVKPNIKKGLKEGDFVSFGYLDANFEYFFKKYKPQKKKQAIIRRVETAELVSSAAEPIPNTSASSFGTAPSPRSVLPPPATNTSFKFGAEMRLDVTSVTYAAPATITTSPGAPSFSFGSRNSKPIASSSADEAGNFGSIATTSTAPSSTGSENTEMKLSNIGQMSNDFRVIAAEDAIMTRRLENYEKTINELQRDKQRLENLISQSNLKGKILEKLQSETLQSEMRLETKLVEAENEVKKLKSELEQNALKGDKLNCSTCKKFGV